MASIIQNIFIFLVLIGIGVFGYFVYMQNQKAGLDTQRPDAGQIAIKANDFLRQLEDLKTVTLDTDVLQDARFSSLVDFSTPIQIEPTGVRSNPFSDN